MQLDNALDVAIGVSFTFLLLASLVSFIQEYIAGVFKWRGTYLDKGIDVILNNSPDASYAWGSIGAWWTAHFSTKAPATQVTAAPAAAGAPPNPNGVNTLAIPNSKTVATIVGEVRAHPLIKNGPNNLPSYLSADSFASALLHVLRDGSALPIFSQIERTVAALPDGDLKTILSGFINKAGGDLDKLHNRVEDWFDAEMDRLSGIYKRVAQYATLVIGAVLIVALNVNSLHLGKELWVESPVQLSAMVAQANNTVASSPDYQKFHDNMNDSLGSLKNLDLPIGWASDKNFVAPNSVSNVGTDAGVILGAAPANIIGWLITLFAITLGAPFWFDIAQNFVNLRNAGQKPAAGGS